MLFRLLDINSDSRLVTFIFNNENTFQLLVKARNMDLFIPFALYDIKITHELPLVNQFGTGFKALYSYSNLGVVIRKTRKSVHIASGHTNWAFPRCMCSLNPGIDVWISVVLMDEPQNEPQNEPNVSKS